MIFSYFSIKGELTISRVADSTIKGFLYQFNLTLKNIIESSSDFEIQVEGIIEDIDVISEKNIKAIQCKYHESQEKFNLSTIYKPILQMLKSYSQNPDADITYILHAHFPSLEIGDKILTEDEIQSILSTNNIDYISNYIAYIKPPQDPEIIELIQKSYKTNEDKKRIKDHYIQHNPAISCDLNIFLKDKFKFEIGKSYKDLELEIKQLLIAESLSESDVQDIFYPNAIQKIAELSINPNDSERLINKLWLLKELKNTKKTAITRWTKELSDYKKLLKVRQRQLSSNLNSNTRKRCFVFEPNNIEKFYDNIVMFVKDFTVTYCHKPKLHHPAVFCIRNTSRSSIDEVVSRLYSKGIEVETGYRGNEFFKDAFIKEPERKIIENWMQFKLRLTHETDEFFTIINENKPDDIFIIGSSRNEKLDARDVNVEILDIHNFEELKYLLKLTTEVR